MLSVVVQSSSTHSPYPSGFNVVPQSDSVAPGDKQASCIICKRPYDTVVTTLFKPAKDYEKEKKKC